MKRFSLYTLALVLAANTIILSAQTTSDDIEQRYRRSSLCSILVKHTEDKFAKEIEEQFLNIPIDDKYNEHNLSVRVVSVSSKGDYQRDINNFVESNNIGSRILARWFNRNRFSGECDMELVKERGLYDASAFDHELASRSARGLGMLQDAGEDLIGKTYLIVNEITYIDKNTRARTWGAIASGLGAIASAYTGNDSWSTLGNVSNSVISSIKGFSVKINSRLYRLVWDEATQATFYKDYYSAKPDAAKKDAFENNRSKFRMEYVGNVVSKGSTTSFLGINEDRPDLMIRKACQRAIEENVADLQKNYEQFRIKAPIISVNPTIQVQIGLKEGIGYDSKFEVLEPEEKDGKIVYKRVAVIKPLPGRIWDNRFMAEEEQAYGANFGSTTFKKVSGGNIYPGLLVREITN